MDAQIFDSLVPAGDAIERLAREYEQAGTYCDIFVCRRVAVEALGERLRDGFLEAWTNKYWMLDHDDWEGIARHEPDYINQCHAGSVPMFKIAPAFWRDFLDGGEDWRSFDLVSSDFGYSYSSLECGRYEGRAYAVLFDPAGLPQCCKVSAQPTAFREIGGHVDPSPSLRGRKSANWWPDFAEELVIYYHNNGTPEGTGTTGQSEMIEGIFRQMAERGCKEPSRTTIQPVINAILKRLRAADK